MINREIKKILVETSKQFPIVSVTGARQCGKTTLIKETFKNYDYINLEEPSIRNMALNDPTKFLQSFKGNLIIDEAQYVPDIFSSVQVISDNNERSGRFILSGSQNFLLLKSIKQSLAGRVGIIKLPTLTFSEIYKYKPKLNIDEIMVKGSYPRIYAYDMNHSWYYENYLDTYIIRDAKDLLDVKNIYSFRKLLNVLASQTGQLLNYNSIAKILNIDQRTVKSWINILCVNYVCFLVMPFYRNINKRLTKTPKLYFYDTGLLSYLLEIESADDYNHSIYKGQIFENFIISEIQKKYQNFDKDNKIYFYRDDTRTEVDIVNLTRDARFNLCEIKSSSLYKNKFIKSINKVANSLDISKKNICVVYGGEYSFECDGIKILDAKSYFDSL